MWYRIDVYSKSNLFLRSLFCLALALFISCNAAIGSSDDKPDASNPSELGADSGSIPSAATELTCNSFAWCSTYSSDSSTPSMPLPEGGDIKSGLYRLLKGAGAPHAIAFSGNTFTRVTRADFNLAGTFRTEDNILTLTVQSDCQKSGKTVYENSFDSEYAYHVVDDEIFLAKDCDETFSYCETTWQFKRIDDLCSRTSDYQCDSGDCECRVIKDDGVPAENSSEVCDIF